MPERMVIKCGSQLVIDPDRLDGVLRLDFMQALLETCQRLKIQGHEVILVLSGAVPAGKKTTHLESKQALASVGQLRITQELAQFAKQIDLSLLLLTQFDITERDRHTTLAQTLTELLNTKIIPVINENDATSADGTHDFADNDHLAAIIAITTQADRVLLCTDVEGMFSAHPTTPGAQLFDEIENVNLELLKMAQGGKSQLGRGGMEGKLRAARLATSAGIQTHIMSGAMVKSIPELVAGSTKFGTVCKARTRRAKSLSTRERWLMSAKVSDGSIVLDTGAAAAVQKRKSLLAVGVKTIYGQFSAGDSVEILDAQKETIAIGLSNLSSEALQVALRSDKKPFDIDVVHANNLILL